MKVKDLWGWFETFATGVFIAFCIILFPLTIFLSLVHGATLEEFAEALDDEGF